MPNNFEEQKQNAAESPSEEPKLSPALQDIWRRTEEGDRNIEWVTLRSGKFIEVPRDGETEKIIWSYGLCDCYSTAVFAEYEDGTRACALTYYPPEELWVNMGTLRKIIPDAEKIKNAKIKKAILSLPGMWKQNPNTHEHEVTAADPEAEKGLILAIQTELGPDVEIIIEPFAEHPNTHVKDEGALAVVIPPLGRGDARYHTWTKREVLSKDAQKA